eukprot:766941-Hanusia_phi.AAC.2
MLITILPARLSAKEAETQKIINESQEALRNKHTDIQKLLQDNNGTWHLVTVAHEVLYLALHSSAGDSQQDLR